MKKYLQITLVLSVFFLVIFLKNNIRIGDDEENRVIGKPTPTSSGQPGIFVTAMPSSASSGKYKDGSYDGTVEDAFYGMLQVRVVIKSGKIVDVLPLQYPSDNNTSRSINEQAFPILKSEAIQVQSSQVDIVTGASDSSPAFSKSLASALKKAQ